jgi:hypothetical protein
VSPDEKAIQAVVEYLNEPAEQPPEVPCEERAYLEGDTPGFPSGALCGSPAVYRNCGTTPAYPCCDEHKCRCRIPLHKPEVPAPSDVWLNVMPGGIAYDEHFPTKRAAEEQDLHNRENGYLGSTPIRYVRADKGER